MNKPENEDVSKQNLFSDETVAALAELGEVLRPIHARLIREGKIKVVDGKIIDCETGEIINH